MSNSPVSVGKRAEVGSKNNGKPTGRMRSVLWIVAGLMIWRLVIATDALGAFKIGTVDSWMGSIRRKTTIVSTTISASDTPGASAATAQRFRGDPVRVFDGRRQFGPSTSSLSSSSSAFRAKQKNAKQSNNPALSAFLQKEPFYQQCDKWAVVTTIYEPSEAVKKVANDLQEWCLVVVADTKTPENYMTEAGWNATGIDTIHKVVFLSVANQMELAKMVPFIQQTPFQSFARKNIGYLYAVWMGASILFDFDDDNLVTSHQDVNTTVADTDVSGEELLADFANMTQINVMVKHVSVADTFQGRAFNPFPMMGSTVSDAWPRGLPLSLINDKESKGQRGPLMLKELQHDNIAVIQSTCDHDPDVDAIFRLSRPLPFSFEKSKANAMTLEVPSHLYSPYNAQATLHFPKAFWGLYLPMTVNGRVSDIWRSYIVQRLLKEVETDAHVLYSPPMVTQFRNAHDYVGDFAAEQHLYLRTEALLQFLDEWKATGGEAVDTLESRIEDLWIELYKRQYIELDDVAAVQEWLKALEQGGYVFPNVKDHSHTFDPSTGGVKDRQECARQRLANWEEPEPTLIDASNFGTLTFDHASNKSVARLLAEYEVGHPFPHSIDLICRAGAQHGPWELTAVIESIQLYWPKCAGRILIVLDIGDENWAHEQIPSWIDVMYSRFEYNMPGRLGNQLFNMYSDQQGRSDYVAIIDSDTVLTTPVTPDLVFSMAKMDDAGNAPPYILAHTEYQKGFWSTGDEWMFQGDSNDLNFMVTLPQVYPRAMFPHYRAGVEAIHGNEFETTDLWEHFRQTVRLGWMGMSQFCLLGNWLVKHWTDSAFDLRTEKDVPSIRYGCHLPYHKGIDFSPGGGKDPASFQKASRSVMAGGICELFCDEIPLREPSTALALAKGSFPKLHACPSMCARQVVQPNPMYFQLTGTKSLSGTPKQQLQVLADHFEPFKMELLTSFNQANTTQSSQ